MLNKQSGGPSSHSAILQELWYEGFSIETFVGERKMEMQNLKERGPVEQNTTATLYQISQWIPVCILPFLF